MAVKSASSELDPSIILLLSAYSRTSACRVSRVSMADRDAIAVLFIVFFDSVRKYSVCARISLFVIGRLLRLRVLWGEDGADVIQHVGRIAAGIFHDGQHL